MIGSTLVGLIGTLLILLVAYDAIRTTLSVSSVGGPLTNRLVSGIWCVLLMLHRQHKRHKMLSSAGPWITITLLMAWFLFAWLGWFLLFCSSAQAVVDSSTNATASIVERAYYAGYTITTLGYGDFIAGTERWRFPPVLAAANGFFLFTLSITYILNIITNVIQKRHTALTVSALGESPWQILATTHDTGKFNTLTSQLQPLQQSISTLGQQHLAYPILHYYHSETGSKSLSLAIARLYQVVALICYACPRLESTTLEQLLVMRKVLEQFMDTLGSAFINPDDAAPPIPMLNAYVELPGVDKTSQEMHDYLASLPYQKLLAAYVHKNGWQWQDVWETSPNR